MVQSRWRGISPKFGRWGLADSIYAGKPSNLDHSGYQYHRLKGNLKVFWSITISEANGTWTLLWAM